MQYADIFLRGVRESFTWHTEEPISLGARVVVRFRKRKVIGIVHRLRLTPPDFPTQAIESILDSVFVDARYITLAHQIAEENFTRVEKVLSLMIPAKFLASEHPEKREKFYFLNDEDVHPRGIKQEAVVAFLKKKERGVSETEIKKVASTDVLRRMEKNSMLRIEEGSIVPALKDIQSRPSHFLTPAQKKVFESIQADPRPSLLFGVTGSGKTEIYKKLAESVVKKDPTAQVLFLLPEIALTPQLLSEFAGVFGTRLAVWHSHLTEAEKVQEWVRIQSGEAQVLIAARSGVLVPLRNPQLIILDEEHEWTYKNEFVPRFSAHDVAESLAFMFEAKLVLGSATPRVESFVRASAEDYHRVDLSTRVHQVHMPRIDLIDMRNEGKKGNYGPISERLAEELSAILTAKKQAVIFLNKRGLSGSAQCKECGHTFRSPGFSQNMKLHDRGGKSMLVCHVSGYMEPLPPTCPGCGAEHFLFRGWGTQRVERELAALFPDIRILRADADTITGRYDFERLITDFHAHKADVLLGTQMIAKGLDFEKVDLVGVILADIGLNLPDFRAEERVFQLLTQVSGRAGRRQTEGRILIQTFRPEESVYDFLRRYDTEGFLTSQMQDRKESRMPPYSALAKVILIDPNKARGYLQAKELLAQLKAQKGIVTHMAPAFFPQQHGKYHFHLFLRATKKEDLLSALRSIAWPANAKIDTSPTSLL